jgi:hypothetical protein
MSIRIRQMFLVCGALVVFHTTAPAAPADACRNILQQFKSAADRASREMASALVNLQEIAGKAADDRRRLALMSQSCAAAAEASGVFKMHRIVVAECTGDREAGRSDLLDRLDRSISQIRVALDKACR